MFRIQQPIQKLQILIFLEFSKILYQQQINKLELLKLSDWSNNLRKFGDSELFVWSCGQDNYCSKLDSKGKTKGCQWRPFALPFGYSISFRDIIRIRNCTVLAAFTVDWAIIKFVRNAFSCLSRCCPRLEIVTVAAMAQQL